MLGIKLKGRFLDLKPGSSTEIQRSSPLFPNTDITAEVTTEVLAFPYTPGNDVAFSFMFQIYSVRRKEKFGVEVYNGNEFRYTATLILESARLNISNIEDAELSGYLVFGASDFFQLIKGKKLSDLKLGGVRSFVFTTNNPTDGSNGYWQHFHATWTDNSIPYVFAPIRNEGYYGEDSDVDWMNKLGNDGKLLYDFYSPIVPMIRKKYLFEEIFLEFGFTVDFSGLNDTEWEKLIEVNLAKLEWVSPQPLPPDGVVGPAPAPAITIDLKNHVATNKTISDYIVQHFGRYGWAPVFDLMKRKVRIVAVKQLGKGIRKDWTNYAFPTLDSSFNSDPKIYAFTTEIDGNDTLPAAPDFSSLKIITPSLTRIGLAEPTPEMEGWIKYCYAENQWYQVQLDETTNLYTWVFFADNIYNEEPANNNETFSTTISTLPVYRTQYRSAGGVDYYGLFAAMKQHTYSAIGYRNLLYHGLVPEVLEDGSAGLISYPYAGSTRVQPLAGSELTWSNVFVHMKNGADFGLIAYWFKDYLTILQGEEDTFDLYLPLNERIAFNWDDEILIANIPYLVMTMTEPDSFKFIRATMKRIVKALPETITTDTGSTSNKVYAHLTVVNITSVGNPIIYQRQMCQVKINLYSDAAATIPYTPPTPLYVYVKTIVTADGSIESETSQYYAVSSAVQIILQSKYKIILADTVARSWTFELDPVGAFNYVIL